MSEGPLHSALPGLAVLDIDGTLTDTIPLHHATMLAVMQSFSFPDLDTNWAGYRHHTDSGIFSEAWQRAGWPGPPEADRVAFAARVEAEFERQCARFPIREIPGAAAFVGALRSAGWVVAFATGGMRGPSRTKLSTAGIAFADDVLVTASEHETREQIVTAAIAAAASRHGPRDWNIVAVGDGLWDMQTAQNLGLHFLGVGTETKAILLRDRGARVLPDFLNVPLALQLMTEFAHGERTR